MNTTVTRHLLQETTSDLMTSPEAATRSIRFPSLSRDGRKARSISNSTGTTTRGSASCIRARSPGSIRRTQKFQFWQTPKEWDTDGGQLGHLAIEGTAVDNRVWIKNSDVGNIYRLDLTTNKFENLGNFKDPRTGKRIGTYGLHSDQQNNVYLLDFSAGNIVKIAAKTKNATVYPTPTPDSRPRRGRVDPQGRLWFAEYQGNAIGMFDPKTEQIKEWRVPTPWSAPYDALLDRNGDAWSGSMLTDRVARLDVKTGQYTEYMLPRPTNIRRVYVDDSKNPLTLWIGSNHGASIVKVEPLD